MFVYEKILRPLLFSLPPETAHNLGMAALRSGFKFPGARLVTRSLRPSPKSVSVSRFGLDFLNPVGIAAGFDKNGEAVDALEGLGFGFVEVGTVTLRPQPGNPKPRMFRLEEDRGIINRLGFNNDGAAALVRRLSSTKRRCVVGINIGKNKDVPNEEALENYLQTFEMIHPVADYVAVNVSSPNTPNLRELQKPESLERLLSGVMSKNRELGEKPLLVKIAPDLSEAEIEGIAELAVGLGLSGIIATNTTMTRDGLRCDPHQEGGLSGLPLREKSDRVISTLFGKTGDRLPIIGVGGVFTAEDAFRKICAGASLVQCYTGLVYRGPGIARDISSGLAEVLENRGFRSLDEAVGSGAAR